MPLKKNALEDARKRLKEKLDSIEEQSEYIKQVLNDTIKNATGPAKELVRQRDRKKFFNKYSAVSQDLEKCLDFLLLVSDSVSALNDEDQLDVSDDGGSTTSESANQLHVHGEESKPNKKEKTEKEDHLPEEKPPREDKKCVEESPVSDPPKTDDNKRTSSPQLDTGQSSPEKPLKQQDEPIKDDTLKCSKPNKEKNTKLDSSEPVAKEAEQISRLLQTSKIERKSNTDSINSSKTTKSVTALGNLKLPREREGNSKKGNSKEKTPKVEASLKVEKRGRCSPTATSAQEKKAIEKKAVSGMQRGSTSKAVKLKPYPFTNGSCIEVIVTEVLSPWELWIQPTGTELDLLMEEMCMQFAKAAGGGYKGGLSHPPSVGEYCCARFTEDDTWYRAQVTGIHQTEDSGMQSMRSDSRGRRLSSSSCGSPDGGCRVVVEVLCVDDGNREKLPLNRLRPLQENFAVLPCQALCCALSGILPIEASHTRQGDSVWNQDAINWLKNKVSGTKLLAYPLRTSNGALVMVDLYLTAPGRSKGPEKHSTLPGLQFNISHLIVRAGLAQFVQQMTLQRQVSQGDSPNSVSSEEPLSRSCSTLSVGSVQDCVMPTYRENAMQQAKGAVTGPEAKVAHSKIQYVDVTSSKDVSEQPSTMQRDEQVTPHEDDTLLQHNGEIVAQVDLGKTPHSGMEQLNMACTDRSTGMQDVLRRSPDGSSFTAGSRDEEGSFDVPVDAVPSCHVPDFPTASQSVCLRVMMSEVVTPSEFYVHLITPEAGLLDVLMDELADHYGGTTSDYTSLPLDYRVNMGDYCCAKFTDDNRWYRAQVKDIKVTPEGRGEDDKFSEDSRFSEDGQNLKAEIEVFYIDFGNTEWLPIGETRPLLAKFMMLPGYAVKCRLAAVQPVAAQDGSVQDDNIQDGNIQDGNIQDGNIQDDNIQAETEVTSTFETPVPLSNPTNATEEKLSSESHNKPEENPAEGSSPSRNQAVASKSPSAKPPAKPLPPLLSRPPRGRRGKKKKRIILDENVVQRAAGDESNDSEQSESGLMVELPESTDGDVVQANKGVESRRDDDTTSALPEKYLLPSPESKTFPSPTPSSSPSQGRVKREWTPEATELFKGLTGDDKSLMGIMVPWDYLVYQQVFCPMNLDPMGSSHQVHITYCRPPLTLQLYDTTEDEDVCINQILVDTGLADTYVEENTTNHDHAIDNAKKVKLTLEDLEKVADNITNGSPLSSRSSSPTNMAMDLWNPMMEDYKSSRNTYRTDIDSAEVALLGYKSSDVKICRFYKYANSICWRGDNCPNLHLKDGEVPTLQAQVYCNNIDSSVETPDIGTWVAVRVTAVLNPGHFWVQFPFGSGPIEKRIIEARSGTRIGDQEDDDEEEDLEAMMARMSKFYDRSLFRDGGPILPAMGELVVAKSGEDKMWYRALVKDIKEGEVQVSFVDYGDSAWIPESDVKRMLPQFLHMPFQAVECLLANVEPIGKDNDDVTTWSKEASVVFESLTADKLLIAQVLSSSSNNTLYLELFDTEDDQELNINKELINKGFARKTNFILEKPRDLKASPDTSDNESVHMIPG